MKMEIYRYLVKEEQLYRAYFKQSTIFIAAQQQAEGLEELKRLLLAEGRETSHSLQRKINALTRMNKGDYLWLKCGENYGLAKIEAPAEFRKGRLEIDVQINEVEQSQIPASFQRVFRGIELSRVRNGEVEEVTEHLFAQASKKKGTSLLSDKGQEREAKEEKPVVMEIFPPQEQFQLEFEKQQGELVEVHPPMVKEKNELTLYQKQDVNKPSSSTPQDRTFELVIEMHAPQDLRIEKRPDRLPMPIKTQSSAPAEVNHLVMQCMQQSLKFYLQWQKMNLEMYLQAQKMYCESYMTFVRLLMK